MYNILLGGAAGDGIETMSVLLEKILKKSGYYVFTNRDAMSRVRGGHNFAQIRFGPEMLQGHRKELTAIVAMNEESFSLHKDRLQQDGVILCDASLQVDDARAIKLPFKEIAKRLGNPKVFGSIAAGALLKLFAMPLDASDEVLAAGLSPELAAVNRAALQEGFAAVSSRFPAVPSSAAGHMLLTGSDAMSLGALAGGMQFYSAYPMSPSSGLLRYFSAHGEKMGVAVEQAEDEIAAVNMALGASYAGARAMTGTSGGGFSLMVEALGFAGIAEIPVVIVDMQRPGPATGLPTRTEQSDLKFVISASQGEFPRMVIAIKHHADMFAQTARAFHLAYTYQLPVILLGDQYLADSSATVPLPDTAALPPAATANQAIEPDKNGVYRRYQITENGISPMLTPGQTQYLVRADSDEHDEYGVITESAEVRVQMVNKRMAKMHLLETELQEPDFLGDEKCETLLVAFGSTYGPIKEAVALLNKEGGKYGALVFGDVHPLPLKSLKHYAAKAKKLINVEQNATGQLASLLREAACISCHSSILKYDGRQLSADDLLAALRGS